MFTLQDGPRFGQQGDNFPRIDRYFAECESFSGIDGAANPVIGIERNNSALAASLFGPTFDSGTLWSV